MVHRILKSLVPHSVIIVICINNILCFITDKYKNTTINIYNLLHKYQIPNTSIIQRY